MSDPGDSWSVVVTGGTGGLGEAVARRFAAEGATVVVADVREEPGQRLVEALGQGARFVRLDVTQEADWHVVRETLNGLDMPCRGLIQCAGILETGTIVEQEPASFRRVLDINLFGTWLGMHVLVPSLARSGEAAIVNFSSTHGIYAKGSMGAYGASKWGVRGLTKTAAIELGADGIRVMSLHPGPIRTEMSAVFNPKMFETMPVSRFGEPEEVASMVWFMVTQATFSTGSEFVIDGGILLGPTTVIED